MGGIFCFLMRNSVPTPGNALQLLNSSDREKSSQSDRAAQLSIIVETVTLDIPDADVLSQAFEKIRTLPKYLKPIVMEGLAKKLKVSKKTLEKSFEAWAMERISQIATTDAQNNSNGEEV